MKGIPEALKSIFQAIGEFFKIFNNPELKKTTEFVRRITNLKSACDWAEKDQELFDSFILWVSVSFELDERKKSKVAWYRKNHKNFKEKFSNYD